MVLRSTGRSSIDSLSDVDCLLRSSNEDRWGALAIGTSKKPPVALLNTPAITDYQALIDALLAMFERRSVVNEKVRRKIMRTPSLGGARPKAVAVERSSQGRVHWLVKPNIASDAVEQGGRWRLAPAYDVVPNTDLDAPPEKLALRVNAADDVISRQALVTDWVAFGFDDGEHARFYLDGLIERLHHTFRERDLPESVASRMVRLVGMEVERLALE